MLRHAPGSARLLRQRLSIDVNHFVSMSRSASGSVCYFRALFAAPRSRPAVVLPPQNWASTLIATRSFGRTACACLPGSIDDKTGDDENKDKEPRPLKLMELSEHMWPSPFKALRNYFLMHLIKGYFDPEFTVPTFLTGAEQAVVQVSSLISRGQFGELKGLVSREAINEIERNYRKLEAAQKQFIAVNPKDLFIRFVCEIGIIFDEQTNKRFVEITTVIQGCHGLGVARMSSDYAEEMKKSQDQLYTCNYRFRREYTKGVEDDWTINKLNHFKPMEHVKQRGLFSR